MPAPWFSCDISIKHTTHKCKDDRMVYRLQWKCTVDFYVLKKATFIEKWKKTERYPKFKPILVEGNVEASSKKITVSFSKKS